MKVELIIKQMLTPEEGEALKKKMFDRVLVGSIEFGIRNRASILSLCEKFNCSPDELLGVMDREVEESKKLVGEMIALTDWTPVEKSLPELKLLGLSEPVWATYREFGRKPGFAVARCWISSEKPHEPIWYLDEDFYHLSCPAQIAEPVTHWMTMPKPPKAGTK